MKNIFWSIQVTENLRYYVAGFTAVILFIYLLETGENDMAGRLFDSLLIILAVVFWVNASAKKIDPDTSLNMESGRTE